jgi:hypothetical protein
MKTNIQQIPEQYCKLVFGLFILSFIFILFGHVYRDAVQLVLKQPIAGFPKSSIDLWSVSHFLLFLACGILMPSKPLTFFTIGCVFELFEDCLSSKNTTQLVDCVSNGKSMWCKGLETDYWYMNPTDPWVNLTGYIIGSAIRTSL